MRRLTHIVLTMHLIGLIVLSCPAPLRAQEAGAANPGAELLDRLGAAYDLLKNDKSRQGLDQLLGMADAAEDEGDPQILLSYYDLTGYAGRREKDRTAEIRGNLHTVLLYYLTAPLDAPDTVTAEFSLSETYRRHALGEAEFFALANMLAASANAARAGPLSDDMQTLQAMADALMGQWMRAKERPELALFFFRRAQALARKGAIDADNAGKIDRVVAEGEEQVAGRAATPLPAPEDCIGKAGLEAERMAACRGAADRAVLLGETARAELILANLLADVPSGSLRAERYDSARDLLLLRQLNRAADDPELLASADLVANYLASTGELGGAALVGARVARTAIDRGRYDPRIAEMCGHIARRAFRNGIDPLARRMLSLQRAVTLIGIGETDEPFTDPLPERRRRRVDAALIRLENAQIASRANLQRLAAREWEAVDREIASVDLAEFEAFEDLTVLRYVGEKTYLFPSYAAAVEFIGRLARRLPVDDPRHDLNVLGWISTVEAWWGDSGRADTLAEQAIREIRSSPAGREDTLVNLLTLRAAFVETTNPPLTARLTREAYEIVAALPGRDSQRVELLLDMATDQTDSGLARALVDEAQKLRQASASVSRKTQARLDLKRSFRAFDEGDKDHALRLGEDAVAGLVAAGEKDKWMIVEPARNLAALYAALGRIEDARKTYETYVFPQSDPVLVGEEKAIDDQLGLANLEAYYGPDDKTIQKLSTLLDHARRRVKADRDLGRRILRAQAFAYHGLGDGGRAGEAARDALKTSRPAATDTTSALEDRKLLETLVGADWLGSRPAQTP